MAAHRLLYDMIIYMYALSLLFYFADFAYANRKAKQMGTGLLVFVWLLQAVYFLIHVVLASGDFIFSMMDTLFLFSWFMVSISLILQRKFKVELFVFFANVGGFAGLLMGLFGVSQEAPIMKIWNINDLLLFVHITSAVSGYAMFATSAVFSGMYLFLHRKLKGKQWSSTMKRLPSLHKIAQYTHVTVVIGTLLLIISLSMGFVWIVLEGRSEMFFDLKVINSMFALAAYLFYLLQHRWLRLPGNKLALWNIAAFVVIVMNFIVTNSYSQFHRWM